MDFGVLGRRALVCGASNVLREVAQYNVAINNVLPPFLPCHCKVVG